ncbi:MAG: hypothetical protein LLF95_05675, partial [Bacteroidales bacterium]|nr:hypothetical protein [Bacteroidales bacterium]
SIVVLFLIVAYAKTKIQNFYKNNATSRTSPNFHSLGRQVCVMWVSFSFYMILLALQFANNLKYPISHLLI